MPTVGDLLVRGYFPKELPPLFGTSSFAKYAVTQSLPAPKQDLIGSLVRFSHSKYASTRRELAIPNPCQYYQLAHLLASHWADLERIWARSSLSKSKPVESVDRAVKGTSDFSDLPAFRAEMRCAGRYLFRADISSFYHSVYTHSIPWALHGKAISKLNRATQPSGRNSTILWGNLADLWSRNLQNGQTIGLPIGPDSSFVVAETILCEIDVQLQNALSGIPGFRFIDDYEFVCGSHPEAEKVLAVVQEELAMFELRLNPRKTTIRELPEPLDTPWVEGLGEFELGASSAFASRLIRYFTRAFELARQHPGEPVLPYATRRFDGLSVDSDSSQLLQRLLLQSATVDPGTLRLALQVFEQHRRSNLPIDRANLSRALNQLVCRHAPLGHGSEVAWCIWAAAVFQAKLDSEAANAISWMRDDIVSLTAMHCEQHGAFRTPPSRNEWATLAQAGTMFDEHWLLRYESIGQGWIAPSSNGDPAASHPFFQALRAANIQFVNPGVMLQIPSTGAHRAYP